MNEKDEKKAPQTFSVRTDLAIEARELAQKDTTDTLEGVAVETDEQADYSLTHVHILSPAVISLPQLSSHPWQQT